MKKNLFFLLSKVILITLILSLTLNSAVLADDNNHGLEEIAEETGLYTEESLSLVVSNIINLILEFLGLIMVIIIMIAGFQWMTAGGSSEIIQKAKARIVNAIIGLVIILCSLSISIFITERLEDATAGDGFFW